MSTKPRNLYVRVWGKGEAAVLVHGSNTANPESTWLQQRDLAERYKLVIPDRRGYGASAPIEQKGFEDNIQDILTVLGTGAHLVGSSYGGVIALLVAARRPEVVRSLTIIEPPAFEIARGHLVVEEFIERICPLYAAVPQITPEDFIFGFVQALGGQLRKPIQLSPERRQSIIATMTEPPPWEAEIPVGTLAATRFPKLVVSGGWHPVFETIADLLARRVGMERAVIQGAGHEVQELGRPFNERLEALWKVSST
ncbi:MAG: alpha/beta hydrolase [Mojavia pulchra JT2-VF2]|jgi:pimeloyl-ACP methyl ester carboxylesterase|uniref:Alpha/beta hydrolase n=1 Tax=Mojavia pulchra JT2-VF2 TaxID=287848 RepID=A0A951Q4D0_9NOST|nr:alpha/beta hydrolase [Mojavia pulchra JT2-VF2]